MAAGLTQATVNDSVAKVLEIQANYLRSFDWVEQAHLGTVMWLHPILAWNTLVPIQTALKLQRQNEY
jgi:hypothetical protein